MHIVIRTAKVQARGDIVDLCTHSLRAGTWLSSTRAFGAGRSALSLLQRRLLPRDGGTSLGKEVIELETHLLWRMSFFETILSGGCKAGLRVKAFPYVWVQTLLKSRPRGLQSVCWGTVTVTWCHRVRPSSGRVASGLQPVRPRCWRPQK